MDKQSLFGTRTLKNIKCQIILTKTILWNSSLWEKKNWGLFSIFFKKFNSLSVIQSKVSKEEIRYWTSNHNNEEVLRWNECCNTREMNCNNASVHQAKQASNLPLEVHDNVELAFVAPLSVCNSSIVALKLKSLPGVNVDSSSSAVCVVFNWFFTSKFSWSWKDLN